ncbi:MAG: LpxA family transferase [Bosea sp.]|uniref:LpxA family transferase n=1 Tax=Bosea sp. (in: a-proteobacteria) TaxID=1871050 RepID=UPI00239AF13F|nr:LpxA family transferase [Bosea sp. (in: a-proteobacteria)]MCP4734176.1 LpxA family transferase [Bosea sp. (in: a-proteobacteria)]
MQFVSEHIAGFDDSVLASLRVETPWELTAHAQRIVEEILIQLDANYRVSDGLAVHQSASVESGATLKGPAIIGPHCFVANHSLIRGGCWLEAECVLGPGAELKSSFLFRGSKLAHFNFVGESILGCNVNLEAGSIIANHRNERPDETIAFHYNGERVDTGKKKFGAVVGDGARIGANAVIAPGAILTAGAVVERLCLIDQAPKIGI